jgi:hypothetical protein
MNVHNAVLRPNHSAVSPKALRGSATSRGGLLGALGLLMCSLCAVAEALLLSRATRKSRGSQAAPALFGPTLTDVGLNDADS